MTIEKLKITEKELNEAVQCFLKQRGIDVLVESVHKEYSYSSQWSVDMKLKEEQETVPLPVEDDPNSAVSHAKQ